MAPAKDTTTPDPEVPEVPVDPAPATDPPADPPTPPADPTPDAEGPALCAECFPWGLPEGYLTAGCEHAG